MLGCFIDFLALRYVLCAAIAASSALSAFTADPPQQHAECVVTPFEIGAYSTTIAFGILASTLEALNMALFRGTPGYLALRIGAPFIPPVARSTRTSCSYRRIGLACTCCIATMGLSRVLCSPWPILAAASFVGVPYALLVAPHFGRVFFWKLHYRLILGSEGFEEWFCSAEDATAIALAHAPTASKALVVGNGASRVPELLASHGRATGLSIVYAIDASAAAVDGMRSRDTDSAIRWHVGDASGGAGTAFRGGSADGNESVFVAPENSFDLIVDKGTYAALREQSHDAFADGFAAAHRALQPGGVLVTVSLAALSPRQLQGAGFTLTESYEVPTVGGRRLGCLTPHFVYAQCAIKQADAESSESFRMPTFSLDDASELGRIRFSSDIPKLPNDPAAITGAAVDDTVAVSEQAGLLSSESV